MKPIRITHFSDTLCVWAYVSQIRIDELLHNFPGAVEVDYRYFHVFGDVPRKMDANWKDRGGIQGYAAHVRGVCEKFQHVTLHPKVWLQSMPLSSMPSHLFLCGIRVLETKQSVPTGTQAQVAWALRESFFRDGIDIAQQANLCAVAEQLQLPVAQIEDTLNTGAAHAALAEDLDMARTQTIPASPTLVFNEGRQRLSGNVGYRIIEANIRELLEGAPYQLSWC